MTNLTDVSEEQLRAELDRREENIPAIPEPESVVNFDFQRLTRLRSLVVRSVTTLVETGREAKDIDYSIYKQAMELVYGPEIWGATNPLLK